MKKNNFQLVRRLLSSDVVDLVGFGEPARWPVGPGGPGRLEHGPIVGHLPLDEESGSEFAGELTVVLATHENTHICRSFVVILLFWCYALGRRAGNCY